MSTKQTKLEEIFVSATKQDKIKGMSKRNGVIVNTWGGGGGGGRQQYRQPSSRVNIFF